MTRAVLAAERIQSLDISLNDLPVGTLVRTPGDYNAFNLLPAYRSMNNPPIVSLSLRSVDGGLRRDPKPIRGALPPFFANLLPEEKLREAMESSRNAHSSKTRYSRPCCAAITRLMKTAGGAKASFPWLFKV